MMYFTRLVCPMLVFVICMMTSVRSYAIDTTITTTIDNTFVTADVTIDAGDTIMWTNLNPLHNVAQSDSAASDVWNGVGFHSGAVGSTDTFQFTFNTLGVFYYICEPHASCCAMKGSVTVLSPLDPDNVFVDFNAGTNGSGTAVSPLNNLQDAVTAANAAAVINMEPGATTETFTGGAEISKALTLRNNTPGSGTVVIGAVSAKSEEESKTGFVSRSGHDDSEP